MHHRRFSSSRVAEVGLGRRETASKVGSRPLDSPTSSPGPLNFESRRGFALHSREKEILRLLRPMITRSILGISSRWNFVARDCLLVKHENSVCFEGTEQNFRKCARSWSGIIRVREEEMLVFLFYERMLSFESVLLLFFFPFFPILFGYSTQALNARR